MQTVPLSILHVQDSDITYLHKWLDDWAKYPKNRFFKHEDEELFIGEFDSLLICLEDLPMLHWGWGKVTLTSTGPTFTIEPERKVVWMTIPSEGTA